jgi:hypothetical protein
MENDPIIKFVEDLREEKVQNPLVHPLVWGSPEEWSNIPQLVARYCIHTQAHLNAVVNYLSDKSTEESTAHLRTFVETENLRQDLTFGEFKKSSNDDITKLFALDKKNNGFAYRLEKDFSDFKNYCDNFKTQSIKELFSIPEKEEDLLKNDNVGHSDYDVLHFGDNTQDHFDAMKLKEE